MPLPQFFQIVAIAAQQHGLSEVLTIVRDPATRQVHFVGTDGALAAMKSEIGEKLATLHGVEDEDIADVEWPDSF